MMTAETDIYQPAPVTSPVEYGPLQEEMMLSAGLDFYKPTMSQLQFEKHPEAEVTFTFKNRGKQRLADYVPVEALQARLDSLRQNGFSQSELDYLANLRRTDGDNMFSQDFVDYLAANELPPVNVWLNEETNDIAIDATGDWPLVTFWETVVMSEVSEMYFENFVTANGLNIFDVYAEGDRRLTEKIEYLKANPGVKISDFGTRRRFSLRWQKHVDERLMNECPDNLVGTSCVALAQNLDLKPIGTFAHEMPMVYAGIADALGKDIRASHGEMIDDWYDRYGDELGVALSDTFGSDFFFSDFTLKRSTNYRSTRQDSGDPIGYGEKTIKHYDDLEIDPLTKNIVFSDGLKIPSTVDPIYRHFDGRINQGFGVGTDLTNDMGLPEPAPEIALGLKALNQVMKATHVKLPGGKEADLVKLSDNSGKHTGPEALVEKYQQIFN